MNYFLTLLIISALQFSSIKSAHATAVIGATFPQQILEMGQSFIRNIAANSTAISTNLDMVNNTILKPISTGLINVAQQQVASDMLSWANGGFEGNPLIISNPEQYIKNQGLLEVKGALNSIPTDSIFGDSIFNEIASQYTNNDIKSQLQSLSKSNIPNLIQQSMCSDEALSSLALKDVQDADGNYDQTELTNRKTQLYNYACQGNPDTDPAVASKLMDLSTQRPELGGWDKWLATTGGDNTYTKVAKAVPLAAKAELERKQFKKDDIFLGQKPSSQTKCTHYEDPVDGEDPKCTEGAEITTTPSDVVASAIEKAANSGLDRLTNLTGEGLSSLIVGLAFTKLTSGINKSPAATKASNNAKVIKARTPPKQDLVGDPTRKTEVRNPMSKQFDYYSSVLSDLENVDQPYLSDVNAYESKVSTGRACYRSLVSSGSLTDQDSRFTGAMNFYSGRQSKIDNIKNTLNPEISKINEAKSLVSSTKGLIAASNSTEEISSIFNDYSAKIDSGNYPIAQGVATRKADYIKNKTDSEQDTEIGSYQSRCESLQSSGSGGGDNGNGGVVGGGQ